VAAFERDDWFEAHELLEPAWMGTDDAGERDLYQGLIKLAAAYVHRARGNALGMSKNLRGALDRLSRAAAVGTSVGGISAAPLLADVLRRLPAPGATADLSLPPPSLRGTEVRA
jgi:predicted metal-dependent hydrolase